MLGEVLAEADVALGVQESSEPQRALSPRPQGGRELHGRAELPRVATAASNGVIARLTSPAAANTGAAR